MDNFEESVIKPNEMLTPDDIKIILDHKDDWNDEEKLRFEDLTEEGFKEIEEKGEVEPEPEPEKEEVSEKSEEKPEPIVDTEKIKEEIDEIVEAKKKELAEAGATKEEQKEAEDKIYEICKYAKNEEGKAFIPKEGMPKDWNHAFTVFIQYLRDHPDLIAENLAPAILTEVDKISQKDQQRINEINKGFDNELKQLHKEGKIPDPTSPEGKEIDLKYLTPLAVKYKLSSMREAYDIWSNIPAERGGGLGYTSKPEEKSVEVKKEEVKKQKQVASRAAGSGGGEGNVRKAKTIDYTTLHNTSLDSLLNE